MQNSMSQMTTIVNTMPINVLQHRSLHKSSLYFHIVLKSNVECLSEEDSTLLKKYAWGFIRATGGSVQSIVVAQNRLHILAGLEKTKAPANFVSQLKLVTKTFAKRKLGLKDFFWSEDDETFTVSLSQIDRVKKYIRRQPLMSEQEKYASSWQRL